MYALPSKLLKSSTAFRYGPSGEGPHLKPGAAMTATDRYCGLAADPGAGGAGRDRTDDLLLAKQALSQLSYSPGLRCGALLLLVTRPSAPGFFPSWRLNWWVWMDSNHRPPPYQDGALTD